MHAALADSPARSSEIQCVVTRAKQIKLPEVQALLMNASSSAGTVVLPPGRIWQDNSSTPHFYYLTTVNANGGGGGATTELHRVDYDDSQSLLLKYAYAKKAGARGVGMWTASSLNYSNAAVATQFWKDLMIF
jgi:hypothetical protein